VPKIELAVRNPSGLHARPAALFVQVAGRFVSTISVENLDRAGGQSVNAKSILLVMTIGVGQGHRIRITADGQDAEQALVALQEAVDGGLGEPVPT
jgi:multiphosphoryl transfer protein